MPDLASPHGGRTSRAVATTALVAIGAVATVGLTAFAVHGQGSRTHAAVALGVPLVVGVILTLILTRHRVARLPVRRLLAAAIISLPALAILGPALALPQLRALFAFRIVLALIGLLGLMWLIVARPRWHLEAATFVVLYAGWFCWLVITLAWAPNPQAGLNYLILFAQLGALAVATASAGTAERRLRYLLLGLAGVLCLSLVVATAEWLLRIHLPTASAASVGRRHPDAFFYNTNDFATYLALCWPFLLLLPTLRPTRAITLLAAAALLATASALLFTGSRSSLLALGLETVIVAVVVVARGGRRRRLVVVALTVVVLLGAGVLLSGRGGRHFQKFDIATIAREVSSGQGSGSVRLQLQVAGLRAAAARWFLGVGPGNAETVVAQQNPGFTVLNLHDWWLEVFVDGGLPALLIFLAMYLSALIAMVRVARYAREPLLRYLGAATAVSLGGCTIAMIGPSTAIKFSPMAILFGLAIAVLIRARREDRESERRAISAASGGSAAGLLG